MPWKKDLAKLKQELSKEEPGPAKAAPPPKVVAKAPVSKCMEEEDVIFLNAMGLRPQAPPRAAAPVAQPAPPPLVRNEPPAAAPQGEFTSAMGDLKGMKPMGRNPIEQQLEPPAQPVAEAPPAPLPEPPPLEPPAPAAPKALPPAPRPEPPAGPTEMHLAAGMAIEVDGRLDLRGHGRGDGEERLKERLLDGYALGWRTLHVHVGNAPELREMVLELLRSKEGGCVARYAQAPVPMGGAQAWILYFRPLPPVGDPV